jgi:hypothetical protein
VAGVFVGLSSQRLEKNIGGGLQVSHSDGCADPFTRTKSWPSLRLGKNGRHVDSADLVASS